MKQKSTEADEKSKWPMTGTKRQQATEQHAQAEETKLHELNFFLRGIVSVLEEASLTVSNDPENMPSFSSHPAGDLLLS